MEDNYFHIYKINIKKNFHKKQQNFIRHKLYKQYPNYIKIKLFIEI